MAVVGLVNHSTFIEFIVSPLQICQGCPSVGLDSPVDAEGVYEHEIRYQSVAWFEDLEKPCPGFLLNKFSSDSWHRRYVLNSRSTAINHPW